MKIMTFNTQHCLNFITREIDFEIMAQAIREESADIVGLNEMRDKGFARDYAAQTEILSKLTGLDHYYFAQAINFGLGKPYGNGLLSRYPIVSAETIPVPDVPNPKSLPHYFETRCLLKAKLSCGLTVLVTHFGLNVEEQQNAVESVLAHLEDKNCILMGDFNVEPDDSILAPIHARMRDTADLFPTPLLSFPSDKPKIKIDYVFVSPDIEVISADIPAIIASDHRPHTATIRF